MEENETVQSTEHEENMIMVIAKRMCSEASVNSAHIFYAAFLEVIEVNESTECSIEEWCIAVESLGKICKVLARQERAYAQE